MSRARAVAWIAAGSFLLALPHAAVSQPAAQADPAVDPAAVAALRRAADFVSSLSAVRLEAEVEYDAVQADGQQIEFGSTRRITLRRPDRIRVDATDRDERQRSLFYDGAQVVLLDREHGVYASDPHAGDIEALVDHLEAKLGIPLPLGELLSAKLTSQVVDGLVSADVVGAEKIDGVACDHLALRSADRGIQIWIEQGTRPLPRRVTVTYEKAPGAPQFRARLAKWELAPRLADSVFVFEPPKGSERIAFNSLAGAAPAEKENR
jgi:hypothetical protein